MTQNRRRSSALARSLLCRSDEATIVRIVPIRSPAQRPLPLARCAFLDGLVEGLEEAAPVEQPGQRIMVCFVVAFERLARRPEDERRGDCEQWHQHDRSRVGDDVQQCTTAAVHDTHAE